MKQIFTLLSLVFITSLATYAQDAKPADPNAANIVFVGGDSHDFGEIMQGDKVSHEFNFKNTGKSDLILSNVSVTCGCTSPYWPKEPIKPGQTSKITVEFNSAGKSGPFNKPITISSNSPESTTKIYIKGKINVPASNDGVPERKPSMVNEH